MRTFADAMRWFEYQARIKAYQLAASMQLSAPRSSISHGNQRTFSALRHRPNAHSFWRTIAPSVGWPNGVFASLNLPCRRRQRRLGCMET